MSEHFEHESSEEYQAGLALHKHLIAKLHPRRGFGVTRNQIEQQLVRLMTCIAEATSRPNAENAFRLLEKADACCVRISSMLQLLLERGYVPDQDLEVGRQLVARVRSVLAKRVKPLPTAPESTVAEIAPKAPAPPKGVETPEPPFPPAPPNGFRPHRRGSGRSSRRPRLQ